MSHLILHLLKSGQSTWYSLLDWWFNLHEYFMVEKVLLLLLFYRKLLFLIEKYILINIWNQEDTNNFKAQEVPKGLWRIQLRNQEKNNRAAEQLT